MSEEQVTKRVIKREVYLQATGLMALALYHKKVVDQCIEALGKTLGEVPSRGGYYDDASDQVYSDGSVDTLLERFNLEIAE